MGDFNFDMLNHNKNKDSATFLDSMYSKFLPPYATAPTRSTSCSRTLIDNIFSNSINNEISLDNTTSTVSDHYGQFFLTTTTTTKKNNSRI